MGFFGRLLGIENESDRRAARQAESGPRPALDPDAQAIERYRYMLRTAPPETLEQAYTEAFAKLSPEQRQKIVSELSQASPEAERQAVASTPLEDPRALARVATRSEIRQPGVMERSLGGGAMGMGASLLSSFAMGFVGSMVAQSFFSAIGGFGAEASPEGEPGDEGAVAENDAENPGAEGDYADDGGGFGDDFEA